MIFKNDDTTLPFLDPPLLKLRHLSLFKDLQNLPRYQKRNLRLLVEPKFNGDSLKKIFFRNIFKMIRKSLFLFKFLFPTQQDKRF